MIKAPITFIKDVRHFRVKQIFVTLLQ